MNVPNIRYILAAIRPIVEAFEQLGVNYHIGGSVASSVHGIIRATIDADIVAELRLEHVRLLVKKLEADYYIDEDAVRDAIKRRSSFNAIHLDTMLKVDVFIPKSRLFDQEELRRARQQPLIENTRPFYVAHQDLISLDYLPAKNASKLLAAGLAAANTSCATKVITISAAVASVIEEARPIGVVR